MMITNNSIGDHSHSHSHTTNDEQYYFNLINDYKKRYIRQRRRNLMKKGILYTYFAILILVGVILYLMTNRLSSFFTFVFLNSIIVVCCTKNGRCCSNRTSNAALQPAMIISAPAPSIYPIGPAIWTVPTSQSAIMPMQTYLIVDPNNNMHCSRPSMTNPPGSNVLTPQNQSTTFYPAPSEPITMPGLPSQPLPQMSTPPSVPPPYSVKDNYADSRVYPVQLPTNPNFVQYANNQPGTSYKL